MSRQVETFDDELARRHRAASLTIYGVAVLTALLMALSLTEFGRDLWSIDPVMDMPLRIVVIVLGLGAVALRRARFAAPRLQAVATLRGASGLLASLQKTTVLLAIIAAVIALLGFALTLIYKDFVSPPMMIWIGPIAFAVLLYAYPRRAAWRRVAQMAREGELGEASGAKGTVA